MAFLPSKSTTVTQFDYFKGLMMSIFSSILEKVGISDPEVPEEDVMPYNPKPAVTRVTDEEEEEDEEYDDEEQEYDEDEGEEYDEEYDDEEEEEAMSETDVLAKLEELADEADEDLNWRTSIVDLLKLLDLDSSLSARKTLAKELGCPAKKMADSAQMNTWLHQAVLQKLADHGGNIPPELLD
jgi:hypothetical protein